jgi:YegS/Rv2252/BmrU family lipid kinase
MRAVIINPASASGRTASRWRRIVEHLEAGGEAFEVMLTTAPGDAIELARRAVRDGMTGLVVLGGDGTVGEVVGGCIEADGSAPVRDGIDISIIHQGTGGDLARGLGIPKDESAAIDVALTGVPRPIDAGVVRFARMDGLDPCVAAQPDGTFVRGFVANSNVGMGSEVVQKVTGRLKKLGNNGAFAVATVGCLARNRERRVLLTFDDGLEAELEIVDVSICNNRYMGGGMLAAPDARLDDGLLDVIMIGGAGRLKLLRTFPKIYKGTHVHDPLVRVQQTAQLLVDVPDGARPEGVVVDGEPVGQTPATWRVLPKAIAVRVPVAAADRITT